jgi:predicted GIY-YIG superfamily endonuclease
MCNPKTEHYVYFLYNHEDELLYIGKTSNLRERLSTYFGKKPSERVGWKKDINPDTLTLFKCLTTTDSEIYETYFINKYKPKHNKGKVFSEKLSFELPYLEPIYPLLNVSVMTDLYNHVLTKKQKKAFRETFKETDFLYFNKEVDQLWLKWF